MLKNRLFPFLLLLISFTFSSYANANSWNTIIANSLFSFNNSLSNKLYEEADLAEHGMSRRALDYAVKGYQELLNQGVVKKSQYLTVIDFSQSHFNKRFYLLDVENAELLVNTYVMHGKNSGYDMAERFSNAINSLQSSLGFYLTRNTYTGKRGYSLRLEGLEPGINSNALARGVVLHGSVYINEERALQGRVERSYGCPAIPVADNAKVINLIKNGSVLFIYHPGPSYVQQSSILNWSEVLQPDFASMN